VAEIRASLAEHDRQAENRAGDTHERINTLIVSLNARDTQVAGDIGELRGKIDQHIAIHKDVGP
jgi:FixJ family two-component response regulator